MKILLKKDIDNLGLKGEVKEAKPGFFYNYLLPKGLAEIATKKVMERIEEKEKTLSRKKKAQTAKIEKIAQRLKGTEIKIEKAATKKKLLYAQVKPEEIIRAIREQEKIKLKPQMVNLPKAVKKIGEFEIFLKLDPETEIKLKLTVAEKR